MMKRKRHSWNDTSTSTLSSFSFVTKVEKRIVFVCDEVYFYLSSLKAQIYRSTEVSKGRKERTYMYYIILSIVGVLFFFLFATFGMKMWKKKIFAFLLPLISDYHRLGIIQLSACRRVFCKMILFIGCFEANK